VVRHLQHIEVDRDKHNLGIGSLLVRRAYDDTRADEPLFFTVDPVFLSAKAKWLLV
jgi:hypothetical protein